MLSTDPSNKRLGPDELVHAIIQRPFIVYAIIYIAGIVVLSWLSQSSAGQRHVYIDVGLCALFGMQAIHPAVVEFLR